MLLKPTSCEGCALHISGAGFMKVTGNGSNGVFLIGESLGADEAEKGEPFVGQAGFTLNKLLGRAGLERDDFLIANVVWCRPPGNKLAGMPYATEAIEHCAPNLDGAIRQHQPRVLVTLGAIAFRRVLPEIANQKGVGFLDAQGKKGVIGYVFWSAKYNCWVVPAVHPSFILRGQTAWSSSLIYCLQRAVEIARDGYSYEEGHYTLDCGPTEAHQWVNEFEAYARQHPGTFLSVDIETPDKADDESELDVEERTDYIILRCGYSYRDGHGMSIPWGGSYHSVHQRLMGHPCDKVFWNAPFDVPRILAD
jgi:uracil-DNA glycosylase family 4